MYELYNSKKIWLQSLRFGITLLVATVQYHCLSAQPLEPAGSSVCTRDCNSLLHCADRIIPSGTSLHHAPGKHRRQCR